MIIDIVFAVLIVMAIIKGYRQGLLMGLFSYIAYLLGLVAAMKLSVVVAHRIGPVVKVSDKWMPFLAFLGVFIAVVILVRWLGKLLQFSLEKIMLGVFNRLGGILLFAGLYTSVYAVFLFYLSKLPLLPQTTVQQSLVYGYIQPFGAYTVGLTGQVIPWFKDLFTSLEGFFEGVANTVK